MKMYQIEYLLATVESGSISRAAEDLMVSRPSVSRALRELEEEFGVELLHRSTAGIVLTEAGQTLYDRCRQMRSLIREIQDEMQQLRVNASRAQLAKLRVGLSFTAQSRLLPVLNAFAREHPNIRLMLSEIQPQQREQGLLDHSLDAEVVLGVDPPGRDIESLTLAETEFVFCCAAAHPLAQRSTVTVPELREEPLVGLNSLSFKENQINRSFEAYGLTPNFRFWTSQIAMSSQMVREGLCSAIKPREGVAGDPSLALVPFDPPIRYPIRLEWLSQVRPSAALVTFTNYLKANVH